MSQIDMATIAYQVNELRGQVKELDENQTKTQRAVEHQALTLAVHDEQISGAGGIVKAMDKLGNKVDGLNRALWAFAGSFVLAAISIALAVH